MTKEFAMHFGEHNKKVEEDGSCVTNRKWEMRNVKSIRRYWDGTAMDNGSGCGVVIEVVDKRIERRGLRCARLRFH